MRLEETKTKRTMRKVRKKNKYIRFFKNSIAMLNVSTGFSQDEDFDKESQEGEEDEAETW